MRAAQISAYGGKNVLVVNDQVPQPVPQAGQVLVQVQAAGINPFDYAVREGLVQQMAELNFPATLGGDVAGLVSATGEGVIDFKIGQAVYGQANALSGQGSFADFTLVKAESLAAKPQTVDFPTAAGLPLVSVSAYQALVDHMNLQTDQKILIHGGAGGIGSMAVQLANYLGAYVAATASAEDADYVKGLGADTVIDYHRQDFSQLLKDYDAVFDTVGGETNQKSYSILGNGGVLVSMIMAADDNLAAAHNIQYVHQFTRVTSQRLTKIAELVDGGKLRLHIDKLFPLAEAAEALEFSKTSHTRGKVILSVAN